MIEKVIEYYGYFVEKVFDFHSELRISDRDTTLLKNFEKIINKKYITSDTVGKDYLFNYLLFQFQYWEGKKTRIRGIYPLNWIFGQKSFDRWIAKDDNWMYYCNLYSNKYNLSSFKLSPFIKEQGKENKIDLQNIERKRFYGKKEGLLNCLEYTDGYNDNNVLCFKCKNKINCKNIKLGK